MSTWLDRALTKSDVLTKMDIQSDPVVSDVSQPPQMQILDDWTSSIEASQTGAMSRATPQGTRDAKQMRRWARTNPVVFAAIRYIKSQITGRAWDVVVDDDVTEAERVEAAQAALRAKKLLQSPNLNAKNNSFFGLVDQFIDDFLTIGIGVIVPTGSLGARLGYADAPPLLALKNFDASRVSFIPGWRSPVDGPRYEVVLPGSSTPQPVNDDKLVVMVMNETTYSESGIPPLRVLHEYLQAFYDTFLSTAAIQRNRAPATLINLPGMPKKEVAKLRQLFDAQIAGNTTMAFLNHPSTNLQSIKMGDVDLKGQAVDFFIDWMVRACVMVFNISPLTVQWAHNEFKAVSDAQKELSLDQGVIPIMEQTAHLFNNRVVKLFHPKISFVWTELVQTDIQEDPQTTHLRASGKDWTSINDLARANGLPEYTFEDHPDADKLADFVRYPKWEVAQSVAMPLPLAARYLEALTVQQECAAAQAQKLLTAPVESTGTGGSLTSSSA